MKKTKTNWRTSLYLLMKISLTQFMIFLVFAVAAMANGTSAQEMLARSVSLDVENTELKTILNQLEKQADVKFAYSQKTIRTHRQVSLQVTHRSLSETLNMLLAPLDISYQVVAGRILLTPRQREKATLRPLSHNEVPVFSAYQSREVKGIVTDEAGGALPGVNIVVKGTQQGTITDVEGHYSLAVPDAGAVLIFSFVGYLSQEVTIGNQASVDIVMQVDEKALEEVVVVGYGTAKRSDLTGAIVSISEKELKSRPVSNALEAMQGKAAGVDITSNERPGEIGQVRIRGARSLTASNDPLYVVDGIPLMSASGIETLNPQDIESVDVLKDASATAVYGSRGANGVVLITTKKGKAGRMTMSYSGTATVENIRDFSSMMTSDEYLTWRRWAYYYADPTRYPRGDQPTQENDFVIFLGANDPYAWANIMKGWAGGTWDGSKVETTDWSGMVTRTAVTQTHTIGLSGGNEKVKAFGSFGYLDNQGTMKGQGFRRYSSKISVDITPYKWFQMGASINTSYSIQQFGQSNTGGQVSGPGSIYAASRGVFPYGVPFDSDGNRIDFPGGDDFVKTVVNEWEYTDNQRTMLRTLGSLYAQVNILPGLRYRLNFGPDFRYFKNGVFIDEKSVNRLGAPNFASLENQNDFSWTLDNLLYYDKSFGRHSVGVTLLQTASSWNQNSSYMRALNIPLPSQKWNALNMSNITALDAWSSDLVERQLMSYMGRINYGLGEKYLFTVSGRWDGASQLAAGHKWAFFPSAAFAWRISQENWLKEQSWLDQLKVRAGVGTTGNSAISPYQTKGGVVSLFYPYGQAITPGYVPSEFLISGGDLAMANQLLGWEKTTQYNVGIDFSVLSNRVYGTIDLYTSRTRDLLMQMSIPPLTGFTKTFANIGETKNKGVDITLNTVNIQGAHFSWETGLNAAWQKDRIVSLANGKEDDIANNWFIGQSIGVLYGYESNGLWREGDEAEMARFNENGHSFQLGMARPKDQNGDYRINPNDDRVIVGHTSPRWTLGLTNSFSYRNFDLSFLLYGRLGYTFNTEGEWQGGRYTQRSIDYYNENNKDAEYQKPIYNVAGGDPYYNILGYRSGSFIKIRTVNLGYTFPAEATGKLGIHNLKLYVQAKNPGMLYSEIDWLDMDLGGSTWNRGFVFGVDIQF